MTNTEIVKSMYQAFGRGDIATLLSGVADNVEWVVNGPAAIPTAGVYRGTAEVGNFFRKVGESIDFEPFNIQQFVEQGDTVVVLGSYSGRSKTLQKPFRSNWAMAFTLRGGKVTRFEEHTDTAALADAFTATAGAARK
jgi:hypothetical protein